MRARDPLTRSATKKKSSGDANATPTSEWPHRRHSRGWNRTLSDAKSILILADSQGVIIDAIGDASTLDEGQDIHLEIGGQWDENVVGTNGIAHRPVHRPADVHPRRRTFRRGRSSLDLRWRADPQSLRRHGDRCRGPVRPAGHFPPSQRCAGAGCRAPRSKSPWQSSKGRSGPSCSRPFCNQKYSWATTQSSFWTATGASCSAAVSTTQAFRIRTSCWSGRN